MPTNEQGGKSAARWPLPDFTSNGFVYTYT